MNWLREHMRDHIDNPIDSPEKIVNFPRNDFVEPRYNTTNVIDLLSHAIEAIRNDQYRLRNRKLARSIWRKGPSKT